jgi:hypothetical protein
MYNKIPDVILVRLQVIDILFCPKGETKLAMKYNNLFNSVLNSS